MIRFRFAGLPLIHADGVKASRREIVGKPVETPNDSEAGFGRRGDRRFGASTLGGIFIAASLALLAGCATYHPLPLPEQPSPARTLTDLHGADARAPLDLPALERLVLANNPELRAARAQRGVATAQMVQAGVLPNPVASLSRGYLVAGAGSTTAWTAALSFDIKTLLTLTPRREAARAEAGAVDAGLLWQEWQTIAKARLLHAGLIEGERLRAVQQETLDLLERNLARVQRSIGDGDLDLGASAPLLAASADAHTQRDDNERLQQQRRHQLNALLGLPPDVEVPLRDELAPTVLDEAAVRAQAADIAQRRPDLVALQLGYRAQEANLRAAVLAQFPALSIGINASQDNSGVRNRGPQLGFDLPLFDRNQGGIATATATRQQLHDEYVVRLDAARNEIDALLAEQGKARAQLDALAPTLADARTLAARADAARRDGDLDARSFADLATTALARRSAAIALEQNLIEQQIALATLLGSGLPTALAEEPTR